MPTTAWHKPELVSLLGDGQLVRWNFYDGQVVLGTELAEVPGGIEELYWARTNELENFSNTAYASDFGFDSEEIGENDSIDGIETEVIFNTHNGSRGAGLRTFTFTKTGFIEDSQNKADRVLAAGQRTINYGAPDDTWGISGLNKSVVEASTFGIFWRTEHRVPDASARHSIQDMKVRLTYTVDGLLSQVTVNGLIAGSEVRAFTGSPYDPGSATEVAGIESSGTSFSFTQPAADTPGYIVVISLGYQIEVIPVTYQAADLSVNVQQRIDRQYLNP